MEVDHEGAFFISAIEVKVANFSSILSHFSGEVGSHHSIDSELVDERINLFTLLLISVFNHGPVGRGVRGHCDDHFEGIAEGITVVEVEEDVLVDGLGADPVSAFTEEFSKLYNVALLEAFLLEEVALRAVLVSREAH